MNAILLILIGVVLSVALWRLSQGGVSNANQFAVIATLAAVAITYNVIVPIPSVEATIPIVVCASLVLGFRVGSSIGIAAILGTSMVASFGIWTLWQVVAISVVAFVSVFMSRAVLVLSLKNNIKNYKEHRIYLVVYATISTIIYDIIVTVPTALSFTANSSSSAMQRSIAALLLGAQFTLVHIAAVAVLLIFIGPSLMFTLNRVKTRLANV